MVTPKRVTVTRDTRKAGGSSIKFHRKERMHLVAIAAGFMHSTVVSEDGLVFSWTSSDPQLKCRQVGKGEGRIIYI